MVVWGLIGGAIARIAMVQAARSERVEMAECTAVRRPEVVPLGLAPLSPLVGVAFFAVLVALFGLLYRLPTRWVRWSRGSSHSCRCWRAW